MDALWELLRFLSEQEQKNETITKIVMAIRNNYDLIKTLYRYWSIVVVWNVVLTGLIIWQFLRFRKIKQEVKRLMGVDHQKEMVTIEK